jgi:hypothetical protein
MRRKPVRLMVFTAALAALAATSPVLGYVGPIPSPDAGLFYSRTVLPDTNTVRVRAAGPIVERVHTPSGRTYCAFRPFAASVRDPEMKSSATHVVWPLFTSRRRGDERSWNSALIAWGRDANVRDPASKWSFILFPFVATGRTADGERYGGLFPLWGRLQEFAGKDKIDFVLFPIYSYTKQKDLNTWNVLFPIISWTRAPDEGRFRVFPLYGQAHEPGIKRRFILWPIWNQAQYSAPQHEGYSHMLFPLYGRVNLDNQQTWMVIPPFFRYTQKGDVRQLNAPWPFFRFSRGGDDEFSYFWPIYGERSRPKLKNKFVLWPLGGSMAQEKPDQVEHRRWFIPFYYDKRTVLESEKPAISERRVRLWPLATYERDQNSLRFHTLELWPASPVDAVERLYAPFWTLYTHERVGTDVADELLWGLFRRTRGEGYAHTSVFPLVSWGGSKDNASKQWDVLKGFIGYEREGDVRRLKLLYFRIGP